jgi:hypothetical protein
MILLAKSCLQTFCEHYNNRIYFSAKSKYYLSNIMKWLSVNYQISVVDLHFDF